jgi:hypothetical protein
MPTLIFSKRFKSTIFDTSLPRAEHQITPWPITNPNPCVDFEKYVKNQDRNVYCCDSLYAVQKKIIICEFKSGSLQFKKDAEKFMQQGNINESLFYKKYQTSKELLIRNFDRTLSIDYHVGLAISPIKHLYHAKLITLELRKKGINTSLMKCNDVNDINTDVIEERDGELHISYTEN